MDKRIRILSLSPFADDHATLAEILQPWPLHHAARLPTAMRLLRSHEIRVIVCERDLSSYSWTDLLNGVASFPKPPLVIVTSRHADDHLWAEALNLGAHDVLAKPFDPAEVARTVRFAAVHWRCNQEPALRPLVMAAGAQRWLYIPQSKGLIDAFHTMRSQWFLQSNLDHSHSARA